MQIVQKQEAEGTIAVQALRLKKLHSGIPFMINSKTLPEGQCYLEYANGNIQLVSIASGGRDFTLIKELTKKEEAIVRKKYNLL